MFRRVLLASSRKNFGDFLKEKLKEKDNLDSQQVLGLHEGTEKILKPKSHHRTLKEKSIF